MVHATAPIERFELRETFSGDGDTSRFWLAVGGGLLLLLLPLLPVFLIGWMVSRTLKGVRNEVSWE